MTIRGVATRHLQRWLQSEQDDPQDPWKTTGVHPAAPAWRGVARSKVGVATPARNRLRQRRDGRPPPSKAVAWRPATAPRDRLPAGARLFASDGMAYTDGYRDAERWRVMPETGQQVSVRGIALSGGALAFDRRAAASAHGPRRGRTNWAPGTTGGHRGQPFAPRRLARRNIRTPGCSVLPAKPLRMPPASAWNTAPRCCRRWTARNSSASTTARQESSTSSNWRSATTAEPASRLSELSQQRGGKGNQEMDEAHGPSWPSLRYG